MALILTFLLGVANFILHRAVLESGHPLLETMAGFFQLMGGKAAFILEFALLLGAMLLVAQGREGWALFYAAYTAANAVAAWLILTKRV